MYGYLSGVFLCDELFRMDPPLVLCLLEMATSFHQHQSIRGKKSNHKGAQHYSLTGVGDQAAHSATATEEDEIKHVGSFGITENPYLQKEEIQKAGVMEGHAEM